MIRYETLLLFMVVGRYLKSKALPLIYSSNSNRNCESLQEEIGNKAEDGDASAHACLLSISDLQSHRERVRREHQAISLASLLFHMFMQT